MSVVVLMWAVFVGCIGTTSAVFYLPGVKPNEFREGQKVEVFVNTIDSVVTQLPYDFYSLHFCRRNRVSEKTENLGEVLAGEEIESSFIDFKMKVEKRCQVMCTQTNTEKDMKKFREHIQDRYRAHWIVDNMPVAIRINEEGGDYHYERGYPVGYVVYENSNGEDYVSEYLPDSARNVKDVFVFNHLSFKILYHEDPSHYEGARIVGFEVEPYSVDHTMSASNPERPSTCDENGILPNTAPQSVMKASDITYTYDITFEKSDITWSTRWNIYLKQGPNENVHWFSILNSTIIVFFLSGIVALILLRTVYKDIATYNAQYEKALGEEGEIVEETGWKLVHADVFRPPRSSPMVLCAIVGTGIQLLAMLFILLFFAVLGFLSPARSGALVTTLLLLFVFMGSVSGYVSARLYKMLGGKKWRRNTILTASLLPFVISVVNFTLNFFVWHERSTKAIPFTTMIAVATLWFGISLPLNFLGAFFGYRKPKVEAPVETNSIPRYIPPRAWYLHPLVLNSLCGILPFGAVFIEVFFIMSAIWLHQIYYLFGFTFVVLCILTITCAEVSIVMSYFHLANENYKWWWQSLWCGGSSAVYLFLYSIIYFNSRLNIEKTTSVLLYFGTMWQISFCFFLVTGAIGFLSSLYFVRAIYSSIKVD